MTAVYDSKSYALANRWDSRHLTTVGRHLDPRHGERILEVGSGRGHLTKRLRNRGVEAIGVDANPRAAEFAVTEGIRTMDASNLEFGDGEFDKLVSIHAIEHIPDVEGALSEMSRVLRPGGRALLVYPAEPIQGIWAVPTSVILHRNPFRAKEVHCQWLWPRRLQRLTAPMGFLHVHSEFNLLSSPQFVTLLERES